MKPSDHLKEHISKINLIKDDMDVLEFDLHNFVFEIDDFEADCKIRQSIQAIKDAYEAMRIATKQLNLARIQMEKKGE